MELKKILTKINTLSNTIQKAYKNDMELLIEWIMEDFDVYERGNNTRIKKEQLLQYINKKLNLEKKTCNALTKNGMLCTRGCYLDSDYCKIHINKMFFDNIKQTDENGESYELLIIESNKCDELDNKSDKQLSKKFIDDTFYYVDNQYIYDTETYERVGYIQNNEYILTDDPFILEQL